MGRYPFGVGVILSPARLLRDPHLARALTGCTVGRMVLLPQRNGGKTRSTYSAECWRAESRAGAERLRTLVLQVPWMREKQRPKAALLFPCSPCFSYTLLLSLSDSAPPTRLTPYSTDSSRPPLPQYFGESLSLGFELALTLDQLGSLHIYADFPADWLFFCLSIWTVFRHSESKSSHYHSCS